MNFAAPYDRTTQWISGLVCLILLAPTLGTRSPIFGALALALIFVAYAYSPRGYAISEGSLVIRRLAGEVRMPLPELSEVRPATKNDFRGCVRLFGSGGLFGYWGRFRTATLGQCTWYVTDRSRAVVARFGPKTILLSPEDVTGFLETVRTFAPPPVETPGAAQATEAGRSSAAGRLGIAIAAAVALLGMIAGILASIYAPGPPSYTLTRDALTIHDRFYPVTLQADQVDVQQIRVVDLASDSDWRPVRRTRGFANAHYQCGWFRAANGRTLRMYRAGGSRLVLLPPKGDASAVLMEARDPEEFLEQLRKEWSNGS